MKVSEAIERFMLDRAAYTSPRTTEWYRYMFDQFLSFVGEETEITVLDEAALQKFLVNQRERPRADFRAGTLSPTTIRGVVRTLKVFFRWLCEHEIIVVNPTTRLKSPHVAYLPRSLTTNQVNELIRFIQTDTQSVNAVRNKALIYFMLDSGCRAAEIIGLEIQSMNLSDGWADVLGKGNKRRRVSFSDVTQSALKDYLAERSSGKVFLTDDGKRFTYFALVGLLRCLGERLGFHLNPHLFRHTFATLFIADGGDPSHAQTLLGHADMSTTQKYIAGARVVAALKAGRAHSVIATMADK